MFQKKEEAIQHYLKKRLNDQMDLTLIKTELKNIHQFDEADVLYISREIADREIDQMNTPKTILGFLNHIIFSYIMAIAALSVVILSTYFIYFEYQLEPASYFDRMSVIPMIFIGGALLMFWKHQLIIKRHNQNRKQLK